MIRENNLLLHVSKQKETGITEKKKYFRAQLFHSTLRFLYNRIKSKNFSNSGSKGRRELLYMYLLVDFQQLILWINIFFLPMTFALEDYIFIFHIYVHIYIYIYINTITHHATKNQQVFADFFFSISLILPF